MGPGPPRLLLERTTRERAAAGNHGREFRLGSRVRQYSPGEQSHRGLHARAGPRGLRDQAEGDLCVTQAGRLALYASRPTAAGVSLPARERVGQEACTTTANE